MRVGDFGVVVGCTWNFGFPPMGLAGYDLVHCLHRARECSALYCLLLFVVNIVGAALTSQGLNGVYSFCLGCEFQLPSEYILFMMTLYLFCSTFKHGFMTTAEGAPGEYAKQMVQGIHQCCALPSIMPCPLRGSLLLNKKRRLPPRGCE